MNFGVDTIQSRAGRDCLVDISKCSCCDQKRGLEENRE